MSICHSRHLLKYHSDELSDLDDVERDTFALGLAVDSEVGSDSTRSSQNCEQVWQTLD